MTNMTILIFNSTLATIQNLCTLSLLSDIHDIMVLQERLGEIPGVATPGNEDVRSGQNDQHVSNDTQQSRQKEAVQGVH